MPLNMLWVGAYNINILYNPVKNKKILMIIKKIAQISTRILPVMLVFLVVLITTSCVKTPENSGYVKGGAVNMDRIKIGVTDKNDVQYLLGSPSSTSTFGEDTWYYIGLKMENSAYLKSEVVDQDILIVKFNENGIVTDIIRKGGEDRRNIAISEDETPTEGNRMTVMEQLLGNLGRYNGGN